MHKYYSIGQYKNVIKTVKDCCNLNRMPIPELTFKGTVKIHGSNSSIYNVLNTNDLITQSRNNIITVESDNHGFARYAKDKEDVFQNLFKEIKEKFPELVQIKTAVVYGEWCGGSIQPGEQLAIGKLEKMFVIFAIKLIDNGSTNESDEVWLKEDQIQDICTNVGKDVLKNNKVFNIYDFQTWEVKIDMNNPKMSQNQLVKITDEVEKQCPVGKAFGIEGLGEGVVWRCVSPVKGLNIDGLVFKVKGQEHSVSHVTSTASVDEEKVKSTQEFIDKIVTDNRLKQGLEYLKEQHLELDTKSMSVFLKWITSDCVKEESDMMKESGLALKEVMPAINNKAKQWFFNQLALANEAEQNNSTKMKI